MNDRWNSWTKSIGTLYRVVIAFGNRSVSSGICEQLCNLLKRIEVQLMYMSRYFIPNIAVNLDLQNWNQIFFKVFFFFWKNQLYSPYNIPEKHIKKSIKVFERRLLKSHDLHTTLASGWCTVAFFLPTWIL